MPLRVYNTLTRQKEAFHKKPGEQVTMYVCGPTVYKPSHIGHMVGPIIFDTVKRYLVYLGYEVKWVINITDVDDKLIVRARELGTTVSALAERMTADYFECLRRLNVTGIDEFPRATQYIAGMIEMMQGLIAKGYAYAAGGDVYFDISKDADYGKLCNRDPEELEAGARIEVSDKKRNPGDFALWKAAKPGEVDRWPSPWGEGRPGWHIECSVMSMKLLGETLDIHGGGLDLKFPHHENELAQSEQATGKPFARFWMHNGLLQMGSGKMAGSIGNVLNVADALKRISGDALRYAFVKTHYRKPIDLGDWDPRDPNAPPLPPNLEEDRKKFVTFTTFAERVGLILGKPFADLLAPTVAPANRTWRNPEFAEAETEFRDAMDDDFNTSKAVSTLFALISKVNRLADEKRLEDPATKDEAAKAEFTEGAALVKELGQVLGLTFALPHGETPAGDGALTASLIQLIVDTRSALRAEAKKIAGKDDPVKKALFDHAGAIRDRLAALGIILEDRPGGTVWKHG
jgi:cysteinyl-tRNA synthetase